MVVHCFLIKNVAILQGDFICTGNMYSPVQITGRGEVIVNSTGLTIVLIMTTQSMMIHYCALVLVNMRYLVLPMQRYLLVMHLCAMVMFFH